MPRIAVTGGVSEGKSTVLGYCRDLGYSTASADDFARQILADPSFRADVLQVVGLAPDASNADLLGEMNRSARSRRTVNRLMHAPVWEKLAACDATFIEVPLLYEACLQAEFDRVWAVTCGSAEQLRRLTARLGDPQAAKKLIESQLPTDVKAFLADRVMSTDAPEAAVRAEVGAAILQDVRPLA